MTGMTDPLTLFAAFIGFAFLIYQTFRDFFPRYP